MKVLFWRLEYYGAVTTGGFASHYDGLINAFLKLGWEVIYVSSGRAKLPKGVKYYFIPHSKLLRNFPEVLNLPYNYKSAKELENIVKVEKPDFIFQQHHDFIFGNYYLRKNIDIPIILFADGFQYWVKKNWGNLYLDKALKWGEQIAWEHCDWISVPSDLIKKQLADNGVEDGKIFVSPSAVDPDFFKPIDNADDIKKKYNLEGKFVCGFSGTFAQWHGVEIIAASMKYVMKSIPNAVFFLVGDGMLRPKMEEIIAKDGMTDNAIFTGLIPFAEMPKYLSACDVLLTPCVNNDDNSDFFNSPIKLFEYMAMEIPVIASDIGQQGVVLKDKVNGFLHKTGDPKAHAEKIIEAYNDYESAKKYAKQARIDVKANYDWLINAKQLIEHFELTKKNRKR